MFKSMLTLAAYAFVANSAHAQESRTSRALEASNVQIQKVEVTGAVRTASAVIVREMGITEGTSTSVADIEAGIQRLKNTQLFSSVSYTIRENTLVVNAVDRWTLIPIAKFSSGGGVSQLILGAYDANLAGRFYESGAQYERLGATNSGVAWFKNPRLFGERIGLDLQAWNINRLRIKYDQESMSPEIKKGFLQSREKYYLAINKELSPKLEVGITLESNGDRFSDQYTAADIKEKTLAAGGLPPNTRFLFGGGRLRYGLVNYDSWRVRGGDVEVAARHGTPLGSDGADENGSVDSFDSVDLRLRYFRPLFDSHVFAWRAMTGTSNTKVVQYLNYFGGLADIRGFADNRFAGQSYWLSNLEYRVPFFERPWLVLQQVVFYDAVSISESYSQLGQATGASIGVGLRIIAPTVYRFVARLDAAKPLVRNDAIPISFGVQQFF